MTSEMPRECAFCTDGLFATYGPNGVERGLCRKHGQELAVAYDQLVGCVRRIYRDTGPYIGVILDHECFLKEGQRDE